MKLGYSLVLLTVFLCGSVIAETGPQSMPSILIGDRVKFVSEPPATGQVGVLYSYTAKAVSSDSTAKIYYFPAPIEMNSIHPVSVDSVTGVVTFTPIVKGWYNLEVIARSTKGGYAIQQFWVTVTGGYGIVYGRVTDGGTGVNSGAGIKNVIISLFKTDTISTTTIQSFEKDFDYFEGEGGFTFWTVTDSSGNYRIKGVDPGYYKIKAISLSEQYLSQWWDGRANAASADLAWVQDTSKGAPDLVNFKLLPVPSKLSVSGSVKDTINAAIKKADVFFVPYNFALNTNNTVEDYRKYFDINAGLFDCRLDGNSQRIVHANTDSIGNYSVKIAAGSYIAIAKARGFVTEFYLEQSSLLLATQITVQKDTSGINFTLTPVPIDTFGVIKGTVMDSSKHIGVPARIIATRDRWLMHDLFKGARSYVIDTDTLGNYILSGLPSGSYFVFALPLGSYAPAYYSNDTASTHWKKASRVKVDSNTVVNNINIYVHQFPVSVNGYAGVSGLVRDAASKAIPGAIVYALLKNNKIAGYAITNTAGAYKIDGLAAGKYSISVDNLGSNETSPYSISLSYNSSSAPVNFSLVQTTTDVALGGTSSKPASFNLAQNYPNPFNPSTTIDYSLNQSGIVTLKVFNILGQEVRTLVNGFQNAGSYRTTFNAQGLSSGIYFYRLKSQNTIQTRKMILLQ